MKIPTTQSVRRADASLDAKLNPVQLVSSEIVSWGEAFPRPAGAPARVIPADALSATKAAQSAWRMDATIGTVLGKVGRTPAESTTD
jgi:hypothetical protein